MYVIGITGRISSGKSTAAHCFRREGFVTVFADDYAHSVLEKDLQPEIKKLIPEAYDEKRKFHRSYVSGLLIDPPEHLKALALKRGELVDKKIRERIAQEKNYGVENLVFEDALLFESGRNRLCDVVICMCGDEHIQDDKALSRGNMTAEKLKAIKNIQMSVAEKISRSDYQIYALNKNNIEIQVYEIIKSLNMNILLKG